MKELNFEKEIILENDHVLLRPLLPADKEHIKVFSLNEPTLWDYSLLPANGLENLQKYLDAAFEAKRNRTSYPFIVFDKRKNEYAGSTRYYDYNKKHNTVQLGYTWYGAAFQGTGLNKNCKYLMLEYAFEVLGLHRVEFRADNTNARSIAAMKSIGCTVEGVLRSNCASPTGRRDSIVLSILKLEWEQSVKSELQAKCRKEKEKYGY